MIPARNPNHNNHRNCDGENGSDGSSSSFQKLARSMPIIASTEIDAHAETLGRKGAAAEGVRPGESAVMPNHLISAAILCTSTV